MAALCENINCLTHKRPDTAATCEVDIVFSSPNELNNTTTERLCRILDESERAYLKQLKDASAQRQYLVAHVLLRVGLSARYPVEPSEWRFAKTRFGQPYIIHPKRFADTSFGLSHTDSLVACAFTPSLRVGIDVEKTAPGIEIDELAGQVLSNYEYTCLKGKPVSDQIRRFYQLWTLKESLLKAIGCGLSVAPSRISIQLNDKANPRLLDLPKELGSSNDWSLRLIRATDIHVSALAVNVSPRNKTHVDCNHITTDMLHRMVCGEHFSVSKSCSVSKKLCGPWGIS